MMGGLNETQDKVPGVGGLSSIQAGTRRENAHRETTKVPKLARMSPAALADRFCAFHSPTFGKVYLTNQLPKLTSCLCLWAHAVLCVKGSTQPLLSVPKVKWVCFPCLWQKWLLFYTSQIINVSKDSESLYLENKQFSLRNMSTAL